MWEADFGAVDEAVANGFDEDEGLVVARVENDFLKLVLVVLSAYMSTAVYHISCLVYLDSLDVVHRCGGCLCVCRWRLG